MRGSSLTGGARWRALLLRADGGEQRPDPGRVPLRNEEGQLVTPAPDPLTELEDVGVVAERVRIRGHPLRAAGSGSLIVEFSTASRGLAGSPSAVGVPRPVDTVSESPPLTRSPSYATSPTRPPAFSGNGSRRSRITWSSRGPSVSKPSHIARCGSGSDFFWYAAISVQPPQAPAAERPSATLTWAAVYSPEPLVRTSSVTSAEAWNASAPRATRCPMTLSASTALYAPPGSVISTRRLSFGGFCSPIRRLPPQYSRAYVISAPSGRRSSARLELQVFGSLSTSM